MIGSDAEQVGRDLFKGYQSLFQFLGHGIQFGIVLCHLDGFSNFRQVKLTGLALFHHHLPAQKIHTLNAGRTFMNRMNPDVAIELLQGEFVTIAVAT